MNILFVTPPPFLPSRLNRVRSYDLIRILSEKHNIYLVSGTIEKNIPDEFNELKKNCKKVYVVHLSKFRQYINCLLSPFLPSEVSFCRSKKINNKIQKILNEVKIDAIYCKRLRSAEYFLYPYKTTKKIKSKFKNKEASIPVFVDTTDAMSLFYKQMSKKGAFWKKPFYFLEYIRYKRFEKKIMRLFRNIIVCTKEDKKYLESLISSQNLLPYIEDKNKKEPLSVSVIPNPVDLRYFKPLMRKKGRNYAKQSSILLFRGLMDKPVNIDAVLYFIQEIFPRLERKIKNIKLLIVGPNPAKEVIRLQKENISVLGYVDDVRLEYLDADIAICPVRIGTGSRHKILQAWAMGVPVVSTQKGAEGLDYENEVDICTARNSTDFINYIVKILNNKNFRKKLISNGHKQAVKYSYRTVSKKLEDVFLYANKNRKIS